MKPVGSITLRLLLAGLVLAGCDQRPGGLGAVVPAPSDVIEAVPTQDDGERGSAPAPAPRPAPRPRAETPVETQPEGEDQADAPTETPDPTVTLNTTPPKAAPRRPDFAISEPPVAVVPAPTAPRPTTPVPVPED